MSLTKEGEKVCKRKLHILFLVSLLFLLVSVPTTCSAESQVIMSQTQYNQLVTTINEQEQKLIMLDNKFQMLQLTQPELLNELNEAKQSSIKMQAQLQSAEKLLNNASNLIDRQNQSLLTLTKEIKAERRQAKIEKYKYAVYGILLGYAFGGMK